MKILENVKVDDHLIVKSEVKNDEYMVDVVKVTKDFISVSKGDFCAPLRFSVDTGYEVGNMITYITVPTADETAEYHKRVANLEEQVSLEDQIENLSARVELLEQAIIQQNIVNRSVLEMFTDIMQGDSK